MTREAFIEILREKGYSYKIEGDKIVITHRGWVNLMNLTSISSDVVFKNMGYVDLSNLTSLPSGVEFNNKGNVWLLSINSLPSDVVFNNGRDVNFESIIGDWFSKWKDIDGIDSMRLLNFMISKGVFER